MPRIFPFLVATLLLLFSLNSYSKNSKWGYNQPYLWNVGKIDKVKKDTTKYAAYRQIISIANAIDESKIVRVTDKTYTFSGDRHNYESLSFYSWPDSTKKDGLPWKNRDGIINPVVYKYDLPRIYALGNNTRILAIAYYITGNERYYQLYVKQIADWFINDSTYMYPQFDYMQILPGHNGNKGNKWGITDACSLTPVIESLRLVSMVNPSFRKDYIPSLRKWFGKFGEWLKANGLAIGERDMGNNQSIVYDELYINTAIFTGDKNMLADGRRLFIKHLWEQINSSTGQQPKELKRTRAYHYSGYNLTHIVDIVTMLKNSGMKVDDKTLTLIDKSFEYIMSYKDKKEEFPFKNISDDWDADSKTLEEDYNRYQQIKGIGDNTIKRYTSVIYSIVK